MCDRNGCKVKPRWEVEFQDDNGDFKSLRLCTRHFPKDYEINQSFVSVREFPLTAEELLKKKKQKDSERKEMEFIERYMR